MATVKIEFETGNDCFDSDPEGSVEQVLNQIRTALHAGLPDRKIRDINGTSIGRIKIS